MAVTEYTYTISTDFPNGKVAPGRLYQEITESAITVSLDHITTDDDTCGVWFESALDTADKTILDGEQSPPSASSIIGSHSGDPLPLPVKFGDGYQIAEDDAELTTTSTSLQQKLRLNATGLLAGTYKVSWSYDCLGSNKGKFKARIQIDDTTTLYEALEELPPNRGWRNCSGFSKVELSDGDHFIDLDFCTSQARGSAHIKNVYLEIVGIGE
jgi:hypothetical protein